MEDGAIPPFGVSALPAPADTLPGVKRWLVRIGVVLAVVALGVAARFTVLAPEAVPVDVVAAATGRVEETVTNSRAGTVKARQRARLSPEFGGQAIEIPYREGDRVKQGQVVLRLENSLQRARLELARRDHDAARAQAHQACVAAERAERERQRVARLAADRIVSTDVLDEVESRAVVAEAACEAARSTAERAAAAVRVAETELEKTVLRAPFDAVVAEVSIEVGEWTTPSPPALPVPPVIDLLDTESIYISAPMDEVDSARIAVGQPARATVDSHRGKTFPGTVVKTAVYVLDLEAQNRTVEIEVELEDEEFASTLLPGTSADVEIILQAKEDVLRVPTVALIEGNRVLVVEEDRLVERTLEVGLKNWNYTEVRSGLEEGELVVVSLDRPEIEAGAEVEATLRDEPAGP